MRVTHRPPAKPRTSTTHTTHATHTTNATNATHATNATTHVNESNASSVVVGAKTTSAKKVSSHLRLLDNTQTPLPMRRLPALRDALNDPAIEPLPPSSMAVPDDVVALLKNAKRVLVVGHVPPDVDCAGSAVGLARALNAFGKDAVACVDFELQGNIRAVDDDAMLQRAADLEGPFDCVVFVDVADAARIGGAARSLQADGNDGVAPSIVVVDHHEPAAHKTIDVAENQPIARFIKPDVDAAGLLVASVVARLEHDLGRIDDAERRSVHAPLAAGAYKDTEGFTLPGATHAGLAMFKHLVNVDEAIALDALEAKLDWTLPHDAARLLDDAVPTSKPSKAYVVDVSLQDRVLERARNRDARTTRDDVRGAAMANLDQLAQQVPVAVALFEVANGVLLSTRSSEPGPALALAQALGGGGHKQKAGGFVPGTLADVKKQVDAWLARYELAGDPRVRFQR